MSIKKWYKKLDNQCELWLRKPVNYTYKNMIAMLSVVYIFSSAFDFSLTYLTYDYTPTFFFNHEFSYIAKMVAKQDMFWLGIAVVVFFLPWVCIYVGILIDRKRAGYVAGWTRMFMIVMFVASYMHMIGGLTNWLHLIRLG